MGLLDRRLQALEAERAAQVRRSVVPSDLAAFGLIGEVEATVRQVMDGPGLQKRLGLLAQRLARGDETDNDRALMARLPAATVPPRTLLLMFMAQERFYPAEEVGDAPDETH